MDGCPAEWGTSPQALGPMRLRLFFFMKKMFLIRVARDGRFIGGQATEKETGQAFCQDNYDE